MKKNQLVTPNVDSKKDRNIALCKFNKASPLSTLLELKVHSIRVLDNFPSLFPSNNNHF